MTSAGCHGVEILGAGWRAEGGLEAIAGGRMANAGAGIDVVIAERGAHQLLDEIGFLVGASRGRDATDRPAAVFGLNALELGCGIGERLVPRDLLPRIRDAPANHRALDAIGMRGIAPRETALDARMSVVGEAVLVGHHPHNLVAANLGLEGTAHAAIAAGSDYGSIGAALFEQRLFHQRVGRTGLHAGAARNAFGIDVMLMLAGDHLRVEAATLDGQRESALGFIARANASRADDASRRIEREVRITVINGSVMMVAAAVAIPDVNETDRISHFVELALAAGLAFEGVERMVGHVEFHHVAAELRELFAMRADFHAGFDGSRAGGGKAFAAVDFDQA
jgi:hypothetical protein